MAVKKSANKVAKTSTNAKKTTASTSTRKVSTTNKPAAPKKTAASKTSKSATAAVKKKPATKKTATSTAQKTGKAAAKKSTTKTTSTKTATNKTASKHSAKATVKKSASAKKTTSTAKTTKSARTALTSKPRTTRSPKNKKTQAELDALAKSKQEAAKAHGHPKTAVAPKRKATSKTGEVSEKATAKKNLPLKKVEPVARKLAPEKLQELCDNCTAWQRKMDPSNFNKSRGAQYHTGPMVLTPNDFGFPEDLPLEAITFLFRITDEGWIGEPEKMVIDNPFVIEKEPRKGAKNGPIFILSETAAICTVAYKENYYWSANVLSKHQVLRIKFVPEKKRTDGKKRNIIVYATFLPNEDD